MGNIFLFTGGNAYALRSELHRWVKEFREKHGEENLTRLVSGEVTFGTILDSVAAAPFIAEFRLVLLEGLPRWTKENLDALEATQHPQVIVAVVDPAPDRRLTTTKEFLKRAVVKEFLPLERRTLGEWAKHVLHSRAASIADNALEHLLDVAGEDQERLAQELEKLSLAVQDRPIGVQDIDVLVFPNPEWTAWKLIDLLAAGKTGEALKFTEAIRARGGNPHELWGRFLLWMVANLVLVTAAAREGRANADSIAKTLSIKPGTVRALLPHARSFDIERLRRVVRYFARADQDIKTGVLRTTGDSLEELSTAIDLGLYAFSR